MLVRIRTYMLSRLWTYMLNRTWADSRETAYITCGYGEDSDQPVHSQSICIANCPSFPFRSMLSMDMQWKGYMTTVVYPACPVLFNITTQLLVLLQLNNSCYQRVSSVYVLYFFLYNGNVWGTPPLQFFLV